MARPAWMVGNWRRLFSAADVGSEERDRAYATGLEVEHADSAVSLDNEAWAVAAPEGLNGAYAGLPARRGAGIGAIHEP